jgi:hypothetical protein
VRYGLSFIRFFYSKQDGANKEESQGTLNERKKKRAGVGGWSAEQTKKRGACTHGLILAPPTRTETATHDDYAKRVRVPAGSWVGSEDSWPRRGTGNSDEPRGCTG